MIFASNGAARGPKLLLRRPGIGLSRARHDALEQEEGSRFAIFPRDSYSICGQLINVEPRRSQDFGDLIHDARSIVARAPDASFAHRPRMSSRA